MDSCKSTSFGTVGLPTWKAMTWWDCCYFFSGAVQQPKGPHCFLLQVPIFFCSSLTSRRTSRRCTGVYLLCGQQTYRLAGTGGTEHLPSGFCGVGALVGEGCFSLCFPDPFLLPSALANSSQTFHLSQFFEYATFRHPFLHFVSYLLLPPTSFCSPTFHLPSGPCCLWCSLPAPPHSGRRLCVLSAPGLFPLGSLQALLKLLLCIEDIWDWGRCCREKCHKSSLEEANAFSSVHVLMVWTLESSGQLQWTKKYK